MSGVLEFLETIGLFDILLPFVMIYVMVFALLERTKIFGTEKVVLQSGKEVEMSKRNLNSIFAFAISFFAILSSQVVGAIARATGPIMLLLFIIVLFILLVSVFKQDSGMHDFSKGVWMPVFITVIVISIILIAMNSIQTTGGETWMEVTWEYITDNTNTGFVGAIGLLLLLAGFVWWIGKEPKAKGDESSGGDD